MNKIFKYFIFNAKNILICLFISLICTLLIIPILLNVDFIKYFIINPYPEHLWSFGLLLIIFLLVTSNYNLNLIKRYLNNFTLNFPPFTIYDFIIWTIIFLFIINTIWYEKNIDILSIAIKDFLAICFCIIIIYYSFSYIAYNKAKKQKNVNNNILNKDSLDDEPIKTIREDLLGREEFINIFLKEIASSDNYDHHSVVFGLHGKWGEGKTSVLNLIKEKIGQEYLIIDFNPWHYKDEQAIISAFFYEIERNISDKYYFYDIKGYLQKYIKLISFGFIQLEFKIDIFTENQTFEKTKKKIQNYINRINKRLIVIIDDIDRLEYNEMQLIFKLVTLIAKFDYFTFILVFDNSLVQKYLLVKGIDKEYLEKIINKSIKLPVPEKSNIDNYLFNGIESILKSNNYNKEEIDSFFQAFSYQYNIKISERFYTLRNVKLFLKGLKFEMPLVVGEVNIFDLCLLLMLKIFSVDIYNDLINNPSIYIDIPISDRFSIEGLFGRNDRNEQLKKIQSHLENLLENETNPELLKYILSMLFSKIAGIYNTLGADRSRNDAVERYQKRINDHESFFKYFLLKVPSNEIPDKYLENILDNWNKADE